jgi:hypothetical protein
VLTDPPGGSGWDFGGFPYGLEPLTLPPAGRPDLPTPDDDPAAFGETCRRIGQVASRGVPDGALERCGAPEVLFSFRWIVGHQVSFVLWRMMALLIDGVVEGLIPRTAVLGPLRGYVRTYTAMLLYTASCPRRTYHDVIRPSMRLQHPGFSGSWAPDYWPVRDLLRSGRLPFAPSPESADLLRAIRLAQLVHDGVAAKLVPDGKSLLRQSAVRRQDMRVLHLIYDNYFMTLRAPVSRHDMVAQLLRRLLAIAYDIAVNDLHTTGLADPHDQPQTLCDPDVRACESSIPEILSQVACCAAGLSREGAGGGLLAEGGRSARVAGH